MHHPRIAHSREGGLRLSLSALFTALVLGRSQVTFAQGCVVSRGTSMTPGQHDPFIGGEEALPPTSGFQGFFNYRWFRSDTMFVNDVEQPHDGREIINNSTFFDVGMTYAFTPRWSATMTIPFSTHDRSQVVPRTGKPPQRYSTSSTGLGDLRFEGNAWIFDPTQHLKGNILLGLGVSAPTGDSDVQDTFEIASGANPRAEIHAVDPSIQLGSGGWGVIFDLNAYREIIPRLNIFLNGTYTMTPEEKYTPTASFIFLGDYSIADSYLVRGGLEYLIWPKYSLSLSLAGRAEGVPVHDLVGGSTGFRRPGCSVSIEPGISVSVKSWSLSLNAPVALYRNREQNIAEKAAGVPPAAASFADFVIIGSISKRF